MSLHEPVIHTARLELHHISAPDLITLFEERDDVPAISGRGFSNPLRVLIDFQKELLNQELKYGEVLAEQSG